LIIINQNYVGIVIHTLSPKCICSEIPIDLPPLTGPV